MSEKQKNSLSNIFHAAFPHTVPIMAGYFVLSVTYGVLMQSKGYSPVWALMVSLLAYSGSMQYASLGFFSVYDPLSALILSLSVNARYLFCSVGMLNKFSSAGRLRPLLFFTLTDESFAVAATTEPPAGMNGGSFYSMIFILNYIYWAAGTLVGGIIGNMLPFDTAGLDFTLTAMYTAMMIDLLRDKKMRACGLIGVACTVFSLIVFGKNNIIIPSLILILTIFIPFRRRIV